MILIFLLISSVVNLLAADEIFFIQWNKILHYENQENSKFWLTGDNSNANEELKKTISAFKSTDFLNTNIHPQCKYPARRMLIEKNFGKDLFPHSQCPDFDEWIERLNPQGISVVFAGNYPDNPGSLFGHTFIKIIGKDSKDEILDYALNYSAEVSDDIGFLYAIKGLIGGYYGGFSLAPYYVKLNEYAEGEGRDIWEYKTALTPEEARLILSHIWELRYQAEFRYYFLSDNCSSFVLNLLDIASPHWRLQKQMPWYIIPLETVKVLHNDSSIITETTYRPSVRLRSQNAFSKLNLSEQLQVQKVLSPEYDLKQANDPKVLKVGVMQIAGIHSQKDGKLPIELAEREEEILMRLSELPTVKDEKSIPLPSPHGGHDITQISLGSIIDSKEDLLIGYRLGVHDLNDYATGYLPYSELSIFDSSLRLNKDKIHLQSLTLLSMKLFRPWNLNQKDWSWTVNATYENYSTVFSDYEKQLVVEGSFGVATQTYDSLLLAFMLGAHIHAKNIDLKEATGLMSEFHLIYNQLNWKFVNGIRLYQDINHSTDSSYQLVPYSKLSLHNTPNFDYELDFTYPLYLKDFHNTPAQLVLKMDYHF